MILHTSGNPLYGLGINKFRAILKQDPGGWAFDNFKLSIHDGMRIQQSKYRGKKIETFLITEKKVFFENKTRL